MTEGIFGVLTSPPALIFSDITPPCLKILSMEIKGLAYNYIRCIIKGNTLKWQLVRHIPLYVMFFKIDGDILTDCFSIASHFNTNFSSIADKVIASLPHSLYEPSKSFSEFLTNKLLSKCKFSIPHPSTYE